MSFFTFSQNNSGGKFDYNKKYGISAYVIVEAESGDEASDFASDLFDRYPNRGYDCHCCGDRWSTWCPEGNEVPSIYNTPVYYSDGTEANNPDFKWMNRQYEGFIHYKNGDIVGFWK